MSISDRFMTHVRPGAVVSDNIIKLSLTVVLNLRGFDLEFG